MEVAREHHLVTTWISVVHPHPCHHQVLAHLHLDTWSPHPLIPMTVLPVILYPQWTSRHREAVVVEVLRPQATHIHEAVEVVVKGERAVEARDQTVSMSVMYMTSCAVRHPRPETAREAAAAGVVSGNIVIVMEERAVVMSIIVAMNTADAKHTAHLVVSVRPYSQFLSYEFLHILFFF